MDSHQNIKNLGYNWLITRLLLLTLLFIFVNSDSSSIGEINLPLKPERPPPTEIGCFEIITSLGDRTRDIIIYWQNIRDEEKHSESFEYLAYYDATKDKEIIINWSNYTYANHATFVGLDTSIEYNFKIYSTNVDGSSAKYSTVHVPSELQKLKKVLSVNKKIRDDGVYELSWKSYYNEYSAISSQLYYYTIFWCENELEYPYQCNGFMNWTHVPNSVTNFNITGLDKSKDYQVAVNVNTRLLKKNKYNGHYDFISNSSGMAWEPCTIVRNNVVGKLKSVWISVVGSMFVGLRWKLDCTDTIGFIEFITFKFCPVFSKEITDCKEPMVNYTLKEEEQVNMSYLKISQLNMSTSYKIAIKLKTYYSIELNSEFLYFTTNDKYNFDE